VPFVPNTDAERAEMLRAVGASSVEELFSDIPEHLHIKGLDLPDGISEIEALNEVDSLAERNVQTKKMDWFLGAGAYYDYIPAAVPALAGRGEFLTAYTPYQPEVSQGTLQAIFEYQSMAAKLLGMSVVNASHYDGATALAEAVLMAWKARDGRNRILLPRELHPEYAQVIETYCTSFDIEFVRYGGAPENAPIDDKTAAIVIAYPNFSGEIYPVKKAADRAHEAGALCIVQADPLMCALMKSPGEQGADIVTAEGQSLGNPLNFGGPYLGIMGTTDALVRRMPGRIVGETKDKNGKRGFVLTLSTREQHIRREKAVSNICSNQGLSMLQTCIYLATLGKQGLREIARQSYDKAHYAAELIGGIPGYSVRSSQFFREFLVETPRAAAQIVRALGQRGIVPGFALSRYYPDRRNELLICVTEMNTRTQIERLAAALREASR
jgi:glycine dehydrogenase subunit 1